jgi:hypothetical protein
VLAYFDRPGASNGPTEAPNGRLEHLRGSALGFRNLTNYIARSLSETGGFRPPTTSQILKSRIRRGTSRATCSCSRSRVGGPGRAPAQVEAGIYHLAAGRLDVPWVWLKGGAGHRARGRADPVCRGELRSVPHSNRV